MPNREILRTHSNFLFLLRLPKLHTMNTNFWDWLGLPKSEMITNFGISYLKNIRDVLKNQDVGMDIIGISSQAFTQRLRGTSRQTSGGTDMASSIRYINNTLCDRIWFVLPVTYICLRPIYPFSHISIEQRAQKICKISWIFIKSPSRFLFPQFNYPFIGYQNSWTFRMLPSPFPFPCFKGYRVSEVLKSVAFFACVSASLSLSLPLICFVQFFTLFWHPKCNYRFVGSFVQHSG